MSETNSHQQMKRELGWFDTTIMGLASVIGVGIFVSLGIAAGLSGWAVILALIVAGLLSACNSLNLAQLAANNPVSGGIYEYGYKYLTPWLGFTGGWIYLLGKTAVAATAALGFSGYLLNAIGLDDRGFIVPIAESAVLILTLIVLGGMQRSKVMTTITVSITIISLVFLIIAGLFVHFSTGFEYLTFSEVNSDNFVKNLLESIALMFVAYNGAARISMVAEEIKEPAKYIPKAIFTTLIITMLLYIGVAIVSLGSIGPAALGDRASQTASLQRVAASFGIPGASNILVIGATTAMLSVLVSIILGLSRLLLAMGRRGDMPSFMAQLDSSNTTPYWAVNFVCIAIMLLVLTGNVKTTWSFGAFGALYRCVIVSLASLKLSAEERLYPKWLSWLALSSCIFLAFWVEWQVWCISFGLIGIGLIWHFTIHRLKSPETLNKILP
jgi:APA family basic amino acid/polyamine antiporter